MKELLVSALGMGWGVLAVLAGLLVYNFTKGNKDGAFKVFIGMLATLMIFMAIANYKNNFFAESRLLPVSLVLITATTFMMALYFSNVSALLKIGGFMFLVAAALSGYGNWLPQVEGGFPPPDVKLVFDAMTSQQLADEGEKIIFGGIGQSSVQVERGALHAADITMETVGRFLDAPDLPDPDLVIRTSGEQRLSNFLLWQSAYSELVFLPTYWPDFDRAALEAAIREYQQRERRFGGLVAKTGS